MLSSKNLIEVFQFPADQMPSKYLDDLIQYPYGCAEQTVSAAFPQIYLISSQTLDANPNPSGLKTISRSYLPPCQKFSKSDGSFSSRPGSNKWNRSLGLLPIGHFMLEAQKKDTRFLITWSPAGNHIKENVQSFTILHKKSFYKPNHGLDQAYPCTHWLLSALWSGCNE